MHIFKQVSIKKVSVVTPNGERTIMTSRPKAVRAVITVRQQVMKHVTISFAKTLASKCHFFYNF